MATTTALARREPAALAPEALRPETWAGAAARALEARNERQAIIANVLVEGQDYGTIPGVEKPCLFKSGAEKAIDSLNLYCDYELQSGSIEDWDRSLFHYRYKAILRQRGSDQVVGTGIGSANSRESKWGYRWVGADQVPADLDCSKLQRKSGTACEPDFAIKKAETGGKYGKPKSYWQMFEAAIADGTARKVKKPKKDGGTMDAWEIGADLFRIPNDDIASQINTIDKMAQKRALVAASLNLGFSEKFTQDMEDGAGDVPSYATHAPAPAAQAEVIVTPRNPAGKPATVVAQAPPAEPSPDELQDDPFPPGSAEPSLPMPEQERPEPVVKHGADRSRGIDWERPIEGADRNRLMGRATAWAGSRDDALAHIEALCLKQGRRDGDGNVTSKTIKKGELDNFLWHLERQIKANQPPDEGGSDADH